MKRQFSLDKSIYNTNEEDSFKRAIKFYNDTDDYDDFD